MESAARVCAIITGSVAFACGVVNLSWWLDPRWGAYTSGALSPAAFLTGFLGFFVMFLMLADRAFGRKRRASQGEIASLVWRTAPRRLLVGLAIVLASAIVGAVDAQAQTGGWGIDDPYGWHHCHWPLSMNHNTQHRCVSHERYLVVQKETDRIFAAFGIGFLTIDCLAFATLSRLPRPTRKGLIPDASAI